MSLLVTVGIAMETPSSGQQFDGGSLDGDFLTGFETGIFLRKQKDQLDEYHCPPAAI